MNSNLTTTIDDQVLKFNVEFLTAKLTVNDSAIGPIPQPLINFFLNYVLKHHVIPRMNDVGKRGFPLPNVQHVQFTNTALVLQQNAIILSTDVKYVGMDDDDDDTINSKTPTYAKESSPSVLYFEPNVV